MATPKTKRPGPGRPPGTLKLGRLRKTARLTINLTAGQVKQLARMAASEDLTVQDFVRKLLFPPSS